MPNDFFLAKMGLQDFLSTVILLVLPFTTNAQIGTPYPFFAPLESGSQENSSACLAQYKSANASGTYAWGPSFINGDILGGDAKEDLSWTVTVAQNTTSGEFDSDLWLGSPPGVDLSLGSLPFSGCTLFMGGISDNLIRRAQTDSGNCSKMLDNECIAALQYQLEQTAFWLVANPTDNSPAPSNLTAGSLPRVCNDIQQAIVRDGAVPEACAKFVGPKRSWYDGEYSNVTFTFNQLTGPNSTTDRTCSFNTTNNVPSFSIPGTSLSHITGSESSLNTTNVTLQDTTYDEAVTNVYPIFTVLFPPANDSNSREGFYSVGAAEAFLSCPRAVNISADSRTPSPLPSPTGLRKITHPLSPGVKAGIAIGVIAGVLLIGGALVFWLRRRRQTRKAAETAAALELVGKKMKDEREALAEKKTPMMDSENVYEAEGDARAEMQGTQTYMELEDTSRAGELDGRGFNHSRRVEP